MKSSHSNIRKKELLPNRLGLSSPLQVHLHHLHRPITLLPFPALYPHVTLSLRFVLFYQRTASVDLCLPSLSLRNTFGFLGNSLTLIFQFSWFRGHCSLWIKIIKIVLNFKLNVILNLFDFHNRYLMRIYSLQIQITCQLQPHKPNVELNKM